MVCLCYFCVLMDGANKFEMARRLRTMRQGL